MMHIDITLGGPLVRYLPEDHTGNCLRFECLPDSTVENVMTALGIDGGQPVLAILNGSVVARTHFPTTSLKDDDLLALMPPIQAG